MALTDYQKVLLDRAVAEAIKSFTENEKASFSPLDLYNAIKDTLDFNLPLSSYGRSLDYSLKRNKIPCRKDNGLYYYDTYHIFIVGLPSLRKEKNLLYFDDMCDEEVYYDFATGTFNIENFLDKVAPRHGYDTIFNDNNFMEALKYEWLFNYCHDVRKLRDIIAECPKSLYEKMMPGLIEEINNNDGVLDTYVLKTFYNKITYKKYYKLVASVTDETEKMDIFLQACPFESIMKMIKNSILEGNGDFFIRNLRHLIDKYCSLKACDFPAVIDSNRSVEYNTKLLNDMLDREKNNILAKQLQRLNFINGYTKNDYIVVVPQSQEDKQNEGKMQNNCVGYYYDNSIMAGDNLIYFVRKTDNPDKSYITCRYRIGNRETVEYRLKNNCSVRDSHDINFIKEVDEIIRKGLGE